MEKTERAPKWFERFETRMASLESHLSEVMNPPFHGPGSLAQSLITLRISQNLKILMLLSFMHLMRTPFFHNHLVGLSLLNNKEETAKVCGRY